MKPYVSLVVFLLFFLIFSFFLCSSLSHDIEIDTSFMAKMHSPNGKLWSQTIWWRIKFRDIILSYFLRTMLSETYIKEFLMESIDHSIFWPYRSTQVF